ncbi:MAG: FtsX-like permease family protein [Luteitalea sp.]|nr:FtsX-like permease family protein [Luteitalea sp.]
MDSLWQDVRYGLRRLINAPAFTLVAVLTLALGVGANTAMFSIVNAVLLQSLPYPDAHRLVRILGREGESQQQASLSAPDFLDYRANVRSFEALAVYRFDSFNLSSAGEPERVRGVQVSWDFFDVLGVPAAAGRVFTKETAGDAGGRLAVLGHSVWQRRFGGNPGIVGRTLTLSDEPFLVVGVMPAGFQLPAKSEIWVTASHEVPELSLGNIRNWSKFRGARYLELIGRLRPGESIAAAQANLDAIEAGLKRRFPDDHATFRPQVVSLHEDLVGDVRPALWVLLAAVGVVLLIACVNVANLLLARSAARQREMAVRLSLGASRARLTRQLLVESMVLGASAGLVGLLVMLWGFDVLVAVLPEDLPRLGEIRIDLAVLGFTLAISVAAGLLFGLTPALFASRLSMHDALKAGGTRTIGHRGHQRFRNAMVVAEVALAVVLVVGAALLVQSLMRLTRVSPGFDPLGVMTMQIDLPEARYQTDASRTTFVNRLREEIAGLPGVGVVSSVYPLPYARGNMTRSFQIEGRPEPEPDQEPSAGLAVVSPRYFTAMHIPVVDGREFTDGDTNVAPDVVIISKALADQHWPGGDPIGRRIDLRGPEDDQQYWATIVGVVGDVRPTALDRAPEPRLYVPVAQWPLPWVGMVVRGSDGPVSAQALRAAVRRVDPTLAAASVDAFEALLSAHVAPRRFNMRLFGFFGLLALTLAMLGTYGVLSYAVAIRRPELAIRLALGATPRSLLWLVVRQGMTLAAVGVALGVLLALGATRALGSLLYGISTADPVSYIVVGAALLVVGAAACYLPARRAMRVQPMGVLRVE